MKIKTIILLLAAVCAGSAFAQGQGLKRNYPMSRPSTFSATPSAATTNSNSNAVATTSSQGGSAQGVGSQGQSLSIDSHATYQAQSRNPVSTAVAAPLTSSNDTCMGSTSLAGSAVSFGVSVGTTWTDNNCVMLKNAREIWNMGFKGAALARLCMDDLNKEALESTGIICPARRSAKEGQSMQTTNVSSADYTGESYRH